MQEAYWRIYRANRQNDEFLRDVIPDNLVGIAKALDYLSDFYKRVADPDSGIRPGGPRLAVVQQPDSEKSLKRAVVIHIGGICRNHFRAPMYSTVTTLANLTLGCDDITQRTVREILRPYASRVG